MCVRLLQLGRLGAKTPSESEAVESVGTTQAGRGPGRTREGCSSYRKVPSHRRSSPIPNADAGSQTRSKVTQLDLDLQALREQRQSSGLVAWLRRLRPFDRRYIRQPDARDVYWLNIQRRLAESDAAFLTRYDPYGSTPAADG